MTAKPWLDLVGLINGYQITQAIYVAAKLRVADHLFDGTRSAGELAKLAKLMKAPFTGFCVHLPLSVSFKKRVNEHFRLRQWATVCANSATPIGAWAEYSGSPYIWQTWRQLLHSIQTGESAFCYLNGMDIWRIKQGAWLRSVWRYFNNRHGRIRYLISIKSRDAGSRCIIKRRPAHVYAPKLAAKDPHPWLFFREKRKCHGRPPVSMAGTGSRPALAVARRSRRHIWRVSKV